MFYGAHVLIFQLLLIINRLRKSFKRIYLKTTSKVFGSEWSQLGKLTKVIGSSGNILYTHMKLKDVFLHEEVIRLVRSMSTPHYSAGVQVSQITREKRMNSLTRNASSVKVHGYRTSIIFSRKIFKLKWERKNLSTW